MVEMRRLLLRAAIAGALAAVLLGAWRAVQRRRDESAIEWEASPFPYPPVPKTAEEPPSAAPAGTRAASDVAEPSGGKQTTTTASDAWVEPTDGECPASHPLKAKLASGIFHAPGGRSYERTKADRCYCDQQAAEADGLRAAKA